MQKHMNEDILLEKLELLNKEKQEIVNSKSYKLGYRILDTISLIKSHNMNQIITNIRNKKATQKLSKKHNSNPIDAVEYEEVDKNSRIAVYTCIVGNYDYLAVPLVTFENVDYFLLTDKPENYAKYASSYKIIIIPEDLMKNGNILANRYVKFHPKDFFKGYDYAIYLDGNVRVVSDIRKFVCKAQVVSGIAMHKHRGRDCVYDEAEACKLYKRGNLEKIKEQTEFYISNGFPRHFGMNEATIIVSDLNNESSSFLLDAWWSEFIRSESYRDQIAWPYVLWTNGYSVDDIGNLGNDIYKNYIIEMLKHR